VIRAGGTSVDVASATFAVAACAAMVAGLVRGFSGFGSALVLSPSLAALYGPKVAVPVALVLELALAVPLVPRVRHLVDWRRIGLLCVAATLTVPVGARLLAVADADALRWAISLVVFLAVALLAFGWGYEGPPHAAATMATGAVSGVLAGSTGLSGPPVIFYELAGTQPVASARASFIVYFSWVDVVAIVVFAIGGALTQRVLLTGVLLTPFYLAAALVGAALFGRASPVFYRRLAIVVLACVAVASLPI
jgi:uncharacterized membrane protein YfcA